MLFNILNVVYRASIPIENCWFWKLKLPGGACASSRLWRSHTLPAWPSLPENSGRHHEAWYWCQYPHETRDGPSMAILQRSLAGSFCRGHQTAQSMNQGRCWECVLFSARSSWSDAAILGDVALSWVQWSIAHQSSTESHITRKPRDSTKRWQRLPTTLNANQKTSTTSILANNSESLQGSIGYRSITDMDVYRLFVRTTWLWICSDQHLYPPISSIACEFQDGPHEKRNHEHYHWTKAASNFRPFDWRFAIESYIFSNLRLNEEDTKC